MNNTTILLTWIVMCAIVIHFVEFTEQMIPLTVFVVLMPIAIVVSTRLEQALDTKE